MQKPLRGKKGCLCCRKRRKKCDERKPTCLACERNFLGCIWEQSVWEPSRLNMNNHDTTLVISHMVSVEASPGNTKISTFSPATSATDRGFPIVLSRISPTKLLMSPVVLRLSQQSCLLFEYYYHRTASVMSTCQGNSNPYIAQLLPIALSNDMVLQTLLVLSGVHYIEEVSVSLVSTVWSHYGKMMKTLRYELSRYAAGSQSLGVPLTIVTLLLASIEASLSFV